MTREEMWKEFENQLIRETRTPITVSYDVSEKMTKSAIERTVAKWKERLEQEPTTKNDCKHCSKTYGTLGCCDTVSNEWVFSCKEGHEEYARGIRKHGSTTKNDLPHCQYTDEEIAKSFIEDVEAVKDQLPKGEQMEFPNTFDEFAKDYGFKDEDEIYTNGSELIPVFRVKQWLEHISTTNNDLVSSIVEKISEEATETREEFIFETIRPYCENVVQMKISKRDLEQALLKYYGKNDLGVDCISRDSAIKALDYDIESFEFKSGVSKHMDDIAKLLNTIYEIQVNNIKALPSVTPQPCEDAVSRKAINGYIDYILSHGMGKKKSFDFIKKFVANLPSVIPQEPPSFQWCTDCKEYDQEKHCCHRWSKVIRDTVEEMKQEQEPRWIPVSERLPETDNENNINNYNVLLWVKNKSYPEREPQIYLGKLRHIDGDDGSGNFWGVETKPCDWTIWGWSYFNEPEVIAWMPLPKPYKAESEDAG